jgi:hypothetical protein
LLSCLAVEGWWLHFEIGGGLVGIYVEKLQHHLASCIMVHTHHHSNVFLGQNVKTHAIVNALFRDVLLSEGFTCMFQTSVKMKLMCQQVVKSLLGEDIDVS